jgi:hypothetical protein
MFQDRARQYSSISKSYSQCMPKQDYRENPFRRAFLESRARFGVRQAVIGPDEVRNIHNGQQPATAESFRSYVHQEPDEERSFFACV